MREFSALSTLLDEVRACTACRDLPLGPRPILQAGGQARILIAGQAPGRITHHKERPFDDPSGDRLRHWLGVDRAVFYDPARFAIIPMGFCFPGTRDGGDLPPRAECAPLWRQKLLAELPHIELTIILGQYALGWHLAGPKTPLMDQVARWREHWPEKLALPHPSPRNQGLFKRHPWFEAELVPMLRERVAQILNRQ
jgi:uracil-DNA glycosylase